MPEVQRVTAPCRQCSDEVELIHVQRAWTWSHQRKERDADHTPLPDDTVTDAIDRLARRLAMAREGMLFGGPAPLVTLLLDPVRIALDDLLQLLEAEPDRIVPATSFALSDDTAGWLAGLRPPPDTPPSDWSDDAG